DWDAFAATFARDARSLYNDGEYRFEGRDAIVAFLRDWLADPGIAAMHQAHTPEIEVTSETTARGSWYLEAFGIDPSDVREGMPTAGGCTRRASTSTNTSSFDGEWKIALTGYRRIFLVVQPLHAATPVQ